jgi:hypothetical protein
MARWLHPLVLKIVIALIALAFLPSLINFVAEVTVHSINVITEGITAPFSLRGDPKIEGLIKLCLYLIAITLLAKFILNLREKK